jgi:hypothetical protein
MYINGREFAVMFFFGLERVLSQDIAELLEYGKYVTGSLSMQSLWTKNIVDSISTALCFFLHSDLVCYVCTAWSSFTRYTPRIKRSCVLNITAKYLKTSFNYKNI